MTQTLLNFFKKIYNKIENAQIAKAIAIVNLKMMRNKVYRDTYNELYRLSDKELNDIGITRCDIHSIAMEAYYDNRVDINPNLRNWV